MATTTDTCYNQSMMRSHVVCMVFINVGVLLLARNAVYAAAPTVTFTAPLSHASDVIPNQKILITFSGLMDPRTITRDTVFLKNGSTLVPGSVTHPIVYNFTRSLSTGSRGDDVLALQRFLIEGGYLKIVTPTPGFGTQPTGYFGYQTHAAVAKWQSSQHIFPPAGYFGPLSRAKANAALTYVFTPASPLNPYTAYTATVTTGAKDPAGNALAEDFVWTFMTDGFKSIPFEVTLTTPANGETEVSNAKKIIVTFNKPFDPLTLTRDTFTVAGPGGKPIIGSVINVGLTSVFTPASPLDPLAIYTATITTGAKDLESMALEHNFSWSFTVGAIADTTIPTFRFLAPLNTDTFLSTNRSLTAVFSEPMDPLTINTDTFVLKKGATNVVGTVGYVGNTATFTPLNALIGNTPYNVTINAGAKDLAGNAMATSVALGFTTAATPDTVPPIVSAVDPADGSSNVSAHKYPLATFSEAMDPLTITTKNFTLKNGTTPIPGTVAYDALSNVATFSPEGILQSGFSYSATISKGAEDLAGNALVNDFVWNFSIAGSSAGPTASLPPPTPSSVASMLANYTATDDAHPFARSHAPITFVEGTSTISQATNPDGSVQLNILNYPGGYADSGFYLNAGSLGNLHNLTIQSTSGSSIFGMNIWFDKDNDGEYFNWTNDVLNGLGQDSYILGPTAQNNLLTVDDTSSFVSMNPGGGNYTLAQLKNGAAPGIDASTTIAIWVGINTGNAGHGVSQTATIQSISIR